MSARLCPRSAAYRRRPIRWRAATVAIGLLAQACAAEPPRLSHIDDPADASTRVPPPAYRPVLGNYAGGRPAEPGPWTGHNDGAAPAPKDGR